MVLLPVVSAVLLAVLQQRCAAQELVSPCPNMFYYEPQTTPGEWVGVVQITTEFLLSGIWMRVKLDRPVISLQTDFGEAVVRDDGYLVKNPQVGLKPGEVRDIRLTVRYNPQEPTPKLEAFRLNGKVFCQATSTKVVAALVSPCPKLLIYDPQTSPGTYSGTIKMFTEQELNGIWLRVVLDEPVIEFKSDFGEAVPRDDGYLLKNREHHLPAGSVESVRFTVVYNSSRPPPPIRGFRLNAKTLCPGEEELPATSAQKTVADLVSPCPSIFSYERTSAEPDRWYGTLTLTTTSAYYGVWIRLRFDRETVQLGNWFSNVDTDNNKDYIISNPNFNLQPGSTKPIRFFIRFDTSQPIPELKAIEVNGHKVC